MRITFLTLFPEMYDRFTSTSIIGRANDNGLARIDTVQIRDFAHDRYRHVDDTPFGGGAGMVMKPQPVIDAICSVRDEGSHVILMDPSGSVYDQKKAHELTGYSHLIFLCGHYEGIDERVKAYVDESLSIGDYVLTGGELASMVIADSVIRLLDGAITADSTADESFEHGLLEYPQYTHPADYQGMKVPDILLSGHHEMIRRWRLQQALVKTRERRPDLFAGYVMNAEEEKLLSMWDEGIEVKVPEKK